MIPVGISNVPSRVETRLGGKAHLLAATYPATFLLAEQFELNRSIRAASNVN